MIHLHTCGQQGYIRHGAHPICHTGCSQPSSTLHSLLLLLSRVGRMPRMWLLCDYCHRTFDMLPRHWKQSRCGPATAEETKTAMAKARARAFNLTRQAAAISEEDLERLALLESDPVRALCRQLGVSVVVNQGRPKKATHFSPITRRQTIRPRPFRHTARSPPSSRDPRPAHHMKVSVEAANIHQSFT